jgi:hypothetical protein
MREFSLEIERVARGRDPGGPRRSGNSAIDVDRFMNGDLGDLVVAGSDEAEARLRNDLPRGRGGTEDDDQKEGEHHTFSADLSRDTGTGQ